MIKSMEMEETSHNLSRDGMKQISIEIDGTSMNLNMQKLKEIKKEKIIKDNVTKQIGIDDAWQ